MSGRRFLVLVGVAVAVLVALTSIGCGRQKLDVVRGVPAVNEDFRHIATDVDALAAMRTDAERARYLQRTWPNLAVDVAYYARNVLHKIPEGRPVDRVEFRFGSYDNVVAETAHGHRRGYVANQLIAVIYARGIEKPLVCIVECMNGLVVFPGEADDLPLVSVHSPIERFTIGPREGLVHHVDFPTAIDLAERLNLPLFSGQRISRGHRITPDQARAMEPNTDWRQVTVYVVEGDRFDLVQRTFTPSPRRPGRPPLQLF